MIIVINSSVTVTSFLNIRFLYKRWMKIIITESLPNRFNFFPFSFQVDLKLVWTVIDE